MGLHKFPIVASHSQGLLCEIGSRGAKAMKRQLLDWCILLSTIANISSAGILLYIAQHRFDVRVLAGAIARRSMVLRPRSITALCAGRGAASGKTCSGSLRGTDDPQTRR